MDQGGELGELCGCCGPGEVLDCALGWAAGEVLDPGVGALLAPGVACPPGVGAPLWPLAGEVPGLPSGQACRCLSRPAALVAVAVVRLTGPAGDVPVTARSRRRRWGWGRGCHRAAYGPAPATPFPGRRSARTRGAPTAAPGRAGHLRSRRPPGRPASPHWRQAAPAGAGAAGRAPAHGGAAAGPNRRRGAAGRGTRPAHCPARSARPRPPGGAARPAHRPPAAARPGPRRAAGSQPAGPPGPGPGRTGPGPADRYEYPAHHVACHPLKRRASSLRYTRAGQQLRQPL